MPSLAYLHSTGPVFVWAQGAGLTIPAQLGTCEQWPVTSDDYSWEPVPNDLAGSMVPLDSQYMGQMEIISLELNRTNIAVSNSIEAAPSPGFTITVPGFDNNSSRGLFLNQNGQGTPLWLVYSYFGTPQAPPDLPKGVYYPNCQMLKASKPQQGTKYLKQHLEILAFPSFAFVNGVWSFTVKSSDPANFVALAGLVPG